MGKFARSYRKTVKQIKIAVVLAAIIFIALYQIATSSYAKFLWYIPAAAIAFGILKLVYRLAFRPATYIDKYGYVVRSATGELEHRHIAKQVLARGLERNEVVHHINGIKTDNAIKNLCVMDRDKHEHFHSWLSWKKQKTGQYPSPRNQRKVLEDEYGGTLLESFRPNETVITPARSVPPDPMLQRRLFVELRRERERIAQERNIPVYVIFHNSTLTEMSERMPDSKHAMLEISGVGKEKYETYGAYFIAVIRNFKAEFAIDQTG